MAQLQLNLVLVNHLPQIVYLTSSSYIKDKGMRFSRCEVLPRKYMLTEIVGQRQMITEWIQ